MKKNLIRSSIFLFSILILFAGFWNFINLRNFQLFGEIIQRVETNEKVVALTFDDGPTAENTDEILRILKELDIKTTFFLIGGDIEKNPESTMKLINAGHEIGNHSYSHKRMVLKSQSFIREEIDRTDVLIKKYGYEKNIHFRPPYSKKFIYLPYYLSKLGKKTIMTDVEPETYVQGTDNIVKYTLEKIQPGSIILLHPWYANAESRKSIKPVVEQLKKDGYKFVTVSELLKY